jgi:hypothetical protein
MYESLQASSENIEAAMHVALTKAAFPPSSALNQTPTMSSDSPVTKHPYIRPSNQKVTLELWLYHVQKQLWHFHNRCQRYSSTLKPNSLQLILRRRKLITSGLEIRTVWLNFMLYVGIAQSERHTETEKSLVINLKRLAVATGQTDYMDLDIDNGKALYMQGDKYLLGFGYF